MKALSVGTIIYKNGNFLMGRATRTGGRHDIFKGYNEEGESHVTTCLRELKEESGIVTTESNLLPLGVFNYMPNKDLSLFLMKDLSDLPELTDLTCTSMVKNEFPEMDSYRWVSYEELKSSKIKVGKKLRELLLLIHEEVL